VACQIQRTPEAARCIRRLPTRAVGEAVRKIVGQIAEDPVEMTKGHSHGARVWDGMLIADGILYYVQISFSHIVNSNLVILLNITEPVVVSGPH
jgi:hypothetical protein